MNLRILILLATIFWCSFTNANDAHITIEPKNWEQGVITAEIDVSPAEFDRLILVFLNLEMAPTLATESKNKFSGWYLTDNEKHLDYNQLWIGDILTAGKSKLTMKISLPAMMQKSNGSDGRSIYKLKLCTNPSNGLHEFLPSEQKVEIIEISKITFLVNEGYDIIDFGEGWKKKDDNWLECKIQKNKSFDSFVKFGKQSLSSSINKLIQLLIAFIVGIGIYSVLCRVKFFKTKNGIIITHILGVLVIVVTLMLLATFKDSGLLKFTLGGLGFLTSHYLNQNGREFFKDVFKP
jgi:hypothetical protein